MKTTSVKPLVKLARAFALSALFLAGTAHASVIWSATDTSSFKSLEEQDCDGNYHSDNGSSAAVVTDSVYGNVIRFRKVTDDRRCEAKGGDNVTITPGQTYYIGWRFKLSNLVNNNSTFQWKSYGSPMTQNYPFVIKMIDGYLTLEHYPGSGNPRVALWRQQISANTWYFVTLKITVSSSPSGGSVQFWFGGDSTPETLLTGGTSYTCKTFDGDTIDPKWGIYGACGTQIDSYVQQLRIGTTYADVDPDGSSGGGVTGFKRIVARHSGRDAVVESASTSDGANIFQYSYSTGTTRNDEWEIISIGSGYYRVMNRHSGKAMVVQSASTASGANVFQWTYGGSATNDEWAIESVGSGYYRFVNRNSGKVLEVAGAGTGNSVNIQQNDWTGATHQQFQLISIP